MKTTNVPQMESILSKFMSKDFDAFAAANPAEARKQLMDAIDAEFARAIKASKKENLRKMKVQLTNTPPVYKKIAMFVWNQLLAFEGLQVAKVVA